MRRSVQLLVALVVCAVPALAGAAPISCPTEFGGDTDFDRQYTLSEAEGCVYGSGPLNGNPGTDVFLNGGAIGGNLGGGWTGILNAEPFGNTPPDTGGLTITYAGPSGYESNWGAWTLTFADLPLEFQEFTEFALGIADGGSPKWAVFLLAITATDFDNGFVSGMWDIGGTLGSHPDLQGAFSHATLYGRIGNNDDDDNEPEQIPEPASVLLLSLGGAAFCRRYRRKQLKQ